MDINLSLKEIVLLKKNLEKDLLFLIKGKKKIKKDVYFGKNVKKETNVFFDASGGKIVIGEGTKIKANVILRGPLVIGKNCVINSFAEISCSRIGDVCKLGGEIMECVIKDYTNKAHHGFLGHSYIGSWVNIGGGTSVSNVKNTYSTIKMDGVDTGMQFLGCVMGDYSKTAINTSIFCGKVIGMSSHLYGMVTEDVPSFSSHIGPGMFYEIPLDVAVEIQKNMMKRRHILFTDKDYENFKKLYNQTANDREKAGVKKEKLTFKLK